MHKCKRCSYVTVRRFDLNRHERRKIPCGSENTITDGVSMSPPNHNATEPNRNAAEPNHNAAEPNHNAVEPNHNAAEQNRNAAEQNRNAFFFV